MKISRICAAALILAFGSVLAFADGIHDPKIVIHGVNGGNAVQSQLCGRKGCQDVGVNFSFTIPKTGKGFLYFTNTSGVNWTSLTLIENGVPAADITCAQGLFLNCTTKTLHNGSVEILLSGVRSGSHIAQNARIGILNGQTFEIGFECVAQSCWTNGGSTVIGHANMTVPEPGTVALMVTGMVAIFSTRKRWLSRVTA